jgi:4-nitrophenyl phosphatase
MPLVRPPRFPLYILDLDGTVSRGEEPIPGVPEAIGRLRDSGARVRFVTNNSSMTRWAIAVKLRRMGIDAVPEDCYGTAHVVAMLAAERGWRKVFMIGETGLQETLRTKVSDVQINAADNPDAVVVGICRKLTYEWLNQGLQGLLSGAEFVATNRDATFPIEGGRVAPGAGAIVAALEAASGRPPVVLGKPEPTLIQLVLRDANLSPGEALIVGDRMDTDILAAARAGCPGYLVLSGVTQTAPENQGYGMTVADLL